MLRSELRALEAPVKQARNASCACGSGRKYKKCCGAGPVPPGAAPIEPANAAAPTLGPEAAPANSEHAAAATLAALVRTADYAGLEQRARALLRERPTWGFAYKLLGLSLWMQGRDAVDALEMAALHLPADAEAHSNLGNALRRSGRLDEAAASHRRALEVDPEYAEAHNNLGSVLLDLGDTAAAAARFSRAVSIKPDFALAHANLGGAMRARGSLAEAVQSYRRAVELRPDLLEAERALGLALYDLGRLTDAAASHRRALTLAPRDPDLHHMLANILLETGEVDEAIAGYRRALVLRPDHAEAHNNLGVALRQSGQFTESEASCRRALELDPGAISARVLQAQILADNGEFAKAESTLRHAIALDPQSPEAWAGIARLRTMTAGDADWLTAVERIVQRGVAPRREVYLRYALGKYFDDLGQYERAFAHYRRANGLTKSLGQVYDSSAALDATDRIIRRYDAEWLRRAQIDREGSPKPVFIVGMPRSGTTLAEQILASHPNVHGAGELSFWMNAWVRHAGASPSGPTRDSSIAEFAAQYRRQLESLSAGAGRVVDKMPGNYMCLGLILAALPDARIIHMRRDPRDTCVSLYFQDFRATHRYACDLDDLAHCYREYLRLMRHWRETLPRDALLEVSYEALVDETETYSRAMLEFVGLPWDPRCLQFHATARTITTFSKWQVRQKVTRASVGRWRHYQAFIEPLLGLAQADEPLP